MTVPVITPVDTELPPSKAGRTAEPSPYQPAVEKSYDTKKAQKLPNVPDDSVDDVLRALDRAKRQLGYALELRQLPGSKKGHTDIYFLARPIAVRGPRKPKDDQTADEAAAKVVTDAVAETVA